MAYFVVISLIVVGLGVCLTLLAQVTLRLLRWADAAEAELATLRRRCDSAEAHLTALRRGTPVPPDPEDEALQQLLDEWPI